MLNNIEKATSVARLAFWSSGAVAITVSIVATVFSYMNLKKHWGI